MITLTLTSQPIAFVLRSALEAKESPPPRRARIVIAKRDALSGQTIYDACLHEFPQAEIVLCRDGVGVLRALHRENADLVVMGLTFPDTDGLDLLTEIDQQKLARQILIVSGRRDEHSLMAFRSAR